MTEPLSACLALNPLATPEHLRIPASVEVSKSDIRNWRRAVADLLPPNPMRYWRDFIISAGLTWAAFIAVNLLPIGSTWFWLAVPIAVLLWYRTSIFIHELAHLQTRKLPGFRTAWNTVVGAPLMLPSILYEGVHDNHHRKATYGTLDDPEYLRLAGDPKAIVAFVAAGPMLPLLLVLRTFVLIPVRFLVPPLRSLIECKASAFTINPAYTRRPKSAERRSLAIWDLYVLSFWLLATATCFAGLFSPRWFVTWYAVYASVATLNHLRTLVAHRYESHGDATSHAGQLADSLNSPGGWWTGLWAPLGIRYHALHHLLPNLPYHNLPIAHRRLTQMTHANVGYVDSISPNYWTALAKLWEGGRK